MNSPAGPIIFMNPPSALSGDPQMITIPPATKELHHEVELVVAIGEAEASAPSTKEEALAAVWGYGVGLDLTRRDVQAALKDAGSPWELAKAFDGSARIGALTPASEWNDVESGTIHLQVNQKTVQEGRFADMIFSVPVLICEIARQWALQPGDLIFTGTPSGVGPLSSGDKLKAEVSGLQPLHVTVA